MKWARALGWGLGGMVAWSLAEPHRVALRHFEVFLPGLPRECEGLKILQLSDLHISAMTGTTFLRQVIERCNALQPDVVALTGDYISRRNSYASFTGARLWARPVLEYAGRMADEIALLKARLGVLAIPGNHDRARDRFEAIGSLLEAVGVTTLENKSVRLGGLPFVGLDDVRAGRPRLEAAFQGVNRSEAQVVLAHNPRLMGLLRGRNALVLAGHTHAGQIHLPLTNFRRRPSDMSGSPWFQGWYRQEGAQMYVSSGLGSVHFPARLRCPPEITLFVLRGAAGDFQF